MKKNILKKTGAAFLSLTMILGSLEIQTAAVLANETTEVSGEAEASEAELQSEDISVEGSAATGINASSATILGTSDVTIGSSYIPDITELPSVRNQNPYGCCWAFSSTTLAEFSILSQEKLTLDLSELQLAYFMYHTVDDPLDLTDGEGCQVSNSSDSDDSLFDLGGDVFQALTVYNAWTGAVTESEVPYELAESAEEDGLSDYLGNEVDVAHLRNAYVIDREENPEGLKEAILTFGAVQCSYYDDAKYYKESTNSYYNNVNTCTNHAVVLVGWDDSYAASNFANKPAGNGAWLLRNSWGVNGYSHNGYFWISYYDTSLSSTAYALDMVSSSNDEFYDNNYQYDGSTRNARIRPGGSNTTTYYANVFTAQGDEILKAANFSTPTANCDYTVSVYTNLTNSENPCSGTLQGTTIGYTTYGGIYTVALADEIALTEGETFSIVISLTNEDDRPYMYTDNSVTESRDSWEITNTASNKAGQSFISGGLNSSSINGGWSDLSTWYTCNLRIKAFTDDLVTNSGTGDQADEEISLTDCDITLAYTETAYTGQKQTPKVTVTYEGTTLTQGTHYTVAYSNNREVGTTARVTVTAVSGSGYTGTRNLYFSIVFGSPTGLTYKFLSNGVQLSWEAVTGATSYKVYRLIDGNYVRLTELTDGQTTYCDTYQLTKSSKITYKITALRTVKTDMEESPNPIVTTITYLAPVTLNAATNVSKGIRLSWTQDKLATGYIVYRSTNGGTYTKLKTITSNATVAYTDTTVAYGNTKYTYRVKSYKKAGSVKTYAAYSATKTCYRVKAVAVSSVANASKGVTIQWKKNSAANGYVVYRKSGSGSYTAIATLNSSSTLKYTDTGATNGAKTQYKVTAYKMVGSQKYESAASSTKTIYYLTRASVSSVTSTKTGKITVKWVCNKKATGYQVKYTVGSTTKTVKITGSKKVSKTISSLKSKKTVKVMVRAYRKVGTKIYYGAWSAAKKVKVK